MRERNCRWVLEKEKRWKERCCAGSRVKGGGGGGGRIVGRDVQMNERYGGYFAEAKKQKKKRDKMKVKTAQRITKR